MSNSLNSVSTAQLAQSLSLAACDELDHSFNLVSHCLKQLRDDQIVPPSFLDSETDNENPEVSPNCIANLILHMSGNLRQWVISGIGGQDDKRDRPHEFSKASVAEVVKKARKNDEPVSFVLLRHLNKTLTKAKGVLLRTTAEDYVGAQKVQEWVLQGTRILMHSVPHFRGHTQEIVHMTRQMLGKSYEFSFVPNSGDPGVTW